MNIGDILNIRSTKGGIIISLEVLEVGKNTSRVLVLHSRRAELVGNTENWGNKTLEEYTSLEQSYLRI